MSGDWLHFERPGCLLTAERDFISCLNDPMTGEVFEHFRTRQKIGDCVAMGFAQHDNEEDLPTGENGLTRLVCRILAEADMNRLRAIHARLRPENRGLPLLIGYWYRVLYD